MSLAESKSTPPPSASRPSTLLAFGMIGLLVAIMLGCAHAFLNGTPPHPVGLYVATIGTAVAVLWFIGRAFQANR